MQYRALAVIAVVGIVAVTVLLLTWMNRRATERRNAVARASHDLHEARSAITRIEGELMLQIEAQHYDPNPLLDIVKTYRKDVTP